MKGLSIVLFGFILFVSTSCQNNLEETTNTKIASIDNHISTSQPYKSATIRPIYTSGFSKRKNIEASSETLLLPPNIDLTEISVFSGLSNEQALTAMFSKLAEPLQTFYIDPKKDTTIIGARGAIFEIKTGTLVFANNKPVVKTIKFEVNEYVDKLEFIYASLSTNTHKGEMLESGGMLLLKAYSENEPLTIAKGKSIQFQIPTTAAKEDMELFSGMKDSHGTVKWNTTKKDKASRSPISRKKKIKKAKKERVIIEETVCVNYLSGEEIYSYNYFNPGRTTFFKKEKLDTVTIHFEIDENNIIKNSWSKRSVNRIRKTKPAFSPYKRSAFLNMSQAYRDPSVIKENDKINLNRDYEVSSGFYNAEYFYIKKSWLKTKKEKKNRAKTLVFSMQRISVSSDTLEKIQIAEEEAYMKNIESKLSVEGPTNIDQLEVDYYIFNTAQLGYINVDRFLHMNCPKTKFVVKNKNLETSTISLVFKNYNSVLRGFEENGKVNFGTVPIGERVTIVAIKMNNGIPMICMKETRIEREKFEQPLEFKPVSLVELKEEMKKINK